MTIDLSHFQEFLICLSSIVSAITVIIVAVKKITAPLKEINDRIKALEAGQVETHKAVLRLTIMSSEMPMTERLSAGEEYVREQGNGAVKAHYEELVEEYKEEIRTDNKN